MVGRTYHISSCHHFADSPDLGVHVQSCSMCVWHSRPGTSVPRSLQSNLLFEVWGELPLPVRTRPSRWTTSASSWWSWGWPWRASSEREISTSGSWLTSSRWWWMATVKRTRSARQSGIFSTRRRSVTTSAQSRSDLSHCRNKISRPGSSSSSSSSDYSFYSFSKVKDQGQG